MREKKRRIVSFVLTAIFLCYFNIANAAVTQDIALKSVAMEALGNIGEESSVSILGEYLNDKEFLLQSSAIYALYKIRSEKALSLLRDKISSQNSRIAVQAAAASLKNHNGLANTVFEGAFRADDNYVRFEAINAAMKMSRAEAVPYIISRLEDNDNSVRIKAVEALTKLGCKDSEALARIENMLYEPDPRLRNVAVLALGESGQKKYIRVVKNMLSDQDDIVAVSSRIALAKLEGRIRKSRINRENENPIFHIANLMLAAEFLDTSEIPYILEDIKNINSSTYLRLSAVSALKEFHDNLKKELLSKLIIRDEKLESVRGSIDFVFRIDNKSITEFFIEALQDKNSPYHNDAPRVLAVWQDRVAGPILVRALDNSEEDSDFIIDVVYALGALREKSALNKIEQFLIKK